MVKQDIALGKFIVETKTNGLLPIREVEVSAVGALPTLFIREGGVIEKVPSFFENFSYISFPESSSASNLNLRI